MLAPVVIFCYDRPNELKRMINTLKKNKEASETDVYVFCDGPKTPQNKQKNDEVRFFLQSLKGFKSLNLSISENNKGLAPSIIAGVSEVLKVHDQVIVLEDDLLLSTNFLAWMNSALKHYKNDKKVFSVSGFCPSVIKDNNFYEYDGFFTHKAHSWGWATWKDRWNQVDWDVKDWNEFSTNRKLQKDFNSIGSEMSGLLFDQMSGKKSSWWVRFCYSQFKLGGYTIYPIYSKVINDGFTAEATHCNVYNRYRVDFDKSNKEDYSLPNEVTEDRQLSNRFFYYYSIRARIIGKIKTILMNKGLIRQYTINI